jgi:hypothetical protein
MSDLQDLQKEAAFQQQCKGRVNNEGELYKKGAARSTDLGGRAEVYFARKPASQAMCDRLQYLDKDVPFAGIRSQVLAVVPR